MNRTISQAARASFVLTSALLFTIAFSGRSKKESDAKKEEEETVFAVNVSKVGQGNLDEYLEFGGDVSSSSSVSVMPDMAGKISRILVSVGDSVAKNQVIAYVDASTPGMYYSQSPVRSPISGIVTSFTPNVGSQVSPAMAVATVSQTDNLEIKISVAERFVSRIKMDQNAFISFNAYPGVEFTAKVVEISPVLDTSTRTMNAKLRLSPNDDRIHVGMYGRVKLITDSVNNVIVVPLGAIVQRDGKPYIFVVSSQKTETEPARVKLQSVSEGITVDNKTEITNGISAGDMIVVKGQSLLNDGSAVNIVSVSE